jgi:hypothetical protein
VLKNAAVVCVHYAASACPVMVELRRCECDVDENDDDDDRSDGSAPAAGHVHICATFTAVGRVLTPAEAGAAFDPYGSGAGLALLVARSFARAMGGDVWLACDDEHDEDAPKCGARSLRIEVRVRLFKPGAPDATDSDGDGVSPTGLAALALTPAATSVLPVELTERIFEHLGECSEDLFTTGDVGPQGAIFVRALSAAWVGHAMHCFLNAQPLTSHDVYNVCGMPPRAAGLLQRGGGGLVWLHAGAVPRAQRAGAGAPR